MKSLKKIKIGYIPNSSDLESPADKRRFVSYAKSRNINFEIANIHKKYDLVILSTLADISTWSKYDKGKVIYELLDSYLAIPKTNIKNKLRGVVGFLKGRYANLQLNHTKALINMCKKSDGVICSTEDQKKTISKYSKNVHIILDIHDSITKNPKTNYESKKHFNLVWEGLPSNIHHLKFLSPILDKLNQNNSVKLNVITDRTQSKYFSFLGSVNIENKLKKISKHIVFHDFNFNSWSKIVRNSDLAIIPIDLLDPFASGKPENKLLLFWRMGLPVLTSPTLAYVSAQKKAGITKDLLCENTDEWINNINKMIFDKELREKLGLQGKSFVEKFHSEELVYKKWDKLFNQLGFKI